VLAGTHVVERGEGPDAQGALPEEQAHGALFLDAPEHRLTPGEVPVVAHLKTQRLAFAVANGIAEEKVILDPGIGFGKTSEHNLELLRRLDELVALGRPVLVGFSRKSFLGRITGREVGERVASTVAVNVLAYERGARLFRVHDVAPTKDALAVAAATVRPGWSATTTPTSSTT
jgi:dihydropteroate synthase